MKEIVLPLFVLALTSMKAAQNLPDAPSARMHWPSYSFLPVLAAAVLLVGVATSAFAHAILVESTPASNSTVAGPNIAITLKFNVRIDAARSRLQVIAPGGTSRSLPLTAGNASNVLLAQANDLLPGEYKLMWQVLASDGHITRGEVVFWVQ
jgi:methionine-rich copper-binding protein CopC